MPHTDSHKYDVFISYSHRDRKKVQDWLLPEIEATGACVCIDFRDFEPGAPSITEIERSVLQSRKTLLVITPDYLKSEWAEFENIIVQTLDPAARNRRLLPLILKPCKKLPLRLQALTYLDFTKPANLDLQFDRLLSALGVARVRPLPGATKQGSPSHLEQKSQSTAQVTLILEGEVQEFRKIERETFISELARILNVSPEQIRLLQVVSGSIRIVLEMPEAAAELLVAMHKMEDAALKSLRIMNVELRRGQLAGGEESQSNNQEDQPSSSINPSADMISILFLAADPSNTSRLRLSEELRDIQAKLQLAKIRDRFRLHQRMPTRATDLSRALLDVQPQIVHFSGHGTTTTELSFEDTLGNIQPAQPDALSALFAQFADRVNCVVLDACYSEAQAEATAKHIPYVIGMNYAMSDEAATAFAVGFYQALGAGRSIEEAYKLGTLQIRLLGIPERLMPILVKKK